MIANKVLISGDVKQYRGNLHCHSTASDGRLSPQELVDSYAAGGYDFLCLSDHNVYNDWRSLDKPGFITIPAIEWDCSLKKGDHHVKTHHINGIHGLTPPKMAPGEKLPRLTYNGIETAVEMANYIKNLGFISMYNHPLWSRVTPKDFGDLSAFHMMEIYNHGCNKESHTGYADVYFDEIITSGGRINITATDDNHNNGVMDSFGGWVCVSATELSREGIAHGLLDGAFYASTGPTIHEAGVKDGVAYVKCSPVHHVNFVAGVSIGSGYAEWAHPPMTEATWKLRGHERYLRIECVDDHGKAAYTQVAFE